MKIAIKIITIVSFTLTFCLAAAGIWWLTQLPPKPPPPDVSRDAVLDINFNAGDENQYVHIDIEPVVVATTIRDVRFVESSESSELILIEHDRRDQPIIRWSHTYTLLIPTSDVQELSGLYAKMFNDTLPLEPEMED